LAATCNNVAKLTQSGADPNWNHGTNGRVVALLARDRFVYAAGGFTAADGQPRNYVAVFDEFSPLLPSWSVDVDGPVRALYDSDGIVMGGDFKRVGSAPHSYLARVTGTPTTGVPTPPALARLSLASTPNPAHARTSFAFTLPAAGPVSLAVFDVTGRQVATALEGETRAAGPHEVPFATGLLRAGLYFARLRFGGDEAIGKLIVLD
jgi:hypothetical protein